MFSEASSRLSLVSRTIGRERLVFGPPAKPLLLQEAFASCHEQAETWFSPEREQMLEFILGALGSVT